MYLPLDAQFWIGAVILPAAIVVVLQVWILIEVRRLRR